MEATCPYSARRVYLEACHSGHTGWPVSVLTEDVPTPELVTEALRSGPYGRCVYDCDNDVCDQQSVVLQFEGGATVTMTTVAFSETTCQRSTRIFGSRGELIGASPPTSHA